MEPLTFDYSLKSIPIPRKDIYFKMLIEKIESFLNRMRWKMIFIENPQMSKTKETYGFNTCIVPPSNKRLKPFEEDLFNMVKNIQFGPVNNKFQHKLREDCLKIRQSSKLIVSADKTGNKYSISPSDYFKLLRDNVTQEYKKSDKGKLKKTNFEASQIAENLGISDRVDQFIEAEAYITIKDHKSSFPGHIECRLINPAKSNLGRVSKRFLQEATRIIRDKTGFNQWQSSQQVIGWFFSLEQVEKLRFFKFDIVSFYPSITKPLLEQAISWAEEYYSFSPQQIEVIYHSRESFLFFNNEHWVKKENPDFDVTMGAYDGAEVCEIVGLFILKKMSMFFKNEHVGLYRDDGLAVTSGSGPEIERTKKKIFKLFQDLGLKITIDANLKQTDFLDIWLDLPNHSFRPYRKEKDNLKYIDIKSNHPKSIKKHLPQMIANRISELSSNQDIFRANQKPYQNALEQAGYDCQREFEGEVMKAKNSKPKARKRKIIWFNPPFNQSVKTNIGGKFLNLIDKHFGNNDLKKFFNRNSIKVSYSCLPSMEAIIRGHNRRLLSKSNASQEENKACNCRGGQKNCPLQGKCLQKQIIYRAEIGEEHDKKAYIGLASNTFKERFLNHQMSFRQEKYKHSTQLSKHLWNQREQGKTTDIKWSVIARAPSYHPSRKKCELCLAEKFYILKLHDSNILNTREEIMNKCRHRNKFLLSNY